MSTTLSVIIVNYNGCNYIKDCINSLYKHLKAISFEIIILDNNSSDISCDYVKINFPEIKLMESKVNYGFGKGNNEAVKRAMGDYLLLINNDTIVLDDLSPVLATLQKDISIGAIGIKMLDANKRYLTSFGNFPNIENMFQMKKLQKMGIEFKTGNFTKDHYEVDWLSGAFILISKKLFVDIGGFDEDYFMYVEDVDLSKKIALKGYKRIFIPKYSFIHFVGFNKSRNPLLIKGYQIYISKHFIGFQKTLVFSALTLNKLVKNFKRALKLE